VVLLPNDNALGGGVHRAGDLIVRQGGLLVVDIVYSFSEGLELSSLFPLGSGDVERGLIGSYDILDKGIMLFATSAMMWILSQAVVVMDSLSVGSLVSSGIALMGSGLNVTALSVEASSSSVSRASTLG
jgi:hypothetical protein